LDTTPQLGQHGHHVKATHSTKTATCSMLFLYKRQHHAMEEEERKNGKKRRALEKRKRRVRAEATPLLLSFLSFIFCSIFLFFCNSLIFMFLI